MAPVCSGLLEFKDTFFFNGMYGNVVPMHYLKGLDVSLDLSEIEMCGP